MRNFYNEQLELLHQRVLQMGLLCEEILNLVVAILEGEHPSDKTQIFKIDSKIDHMERDIETQCVSLMLRQQPIASDLRTISSTLKVITDMERIGDQARDIGDLLPHVKEQTTPEVGMVLTMAKATIKMVTDSVNAFSNRNTTLAGEVIMYDDMVDDYFKNVKQYLIGLIKNEKVDGEYALDLLMMAKYFERIGDHATNIAEWAIYVVTGVHQSSEMDK